MTEPPNHPWDGSSCRPTTSLHPHAVTPHPTGANCLEALEAPASSFRTASAAWLLQDPTSPMIQPPTQTRTASAAAKKDHLHPIILEHERLTALMRIMLRGSGAERERLLPRLERELLAQAQAEEEALYTALRELPEARAATHRSLIEHDDIVGALEELAHIDRGSRRFGDKLRLLRVRVQRHIDREQDELFPLVAEALDDEELRSLAERVDTEKQHRLEALSETSSVA